MPEAKPAEAVSLECALSHLAADGLVALPTETVWGLAARAQSVAAVGRLRAFKGRHDDQPISVLIDQPQTLESLGFALGPTARAVVDAFWPGPLTVILPGSAESPFAAGIAGPTGAVGFRCSDHPLCGMFVRSALERGLGPVTATSFNHRGETPVRSRPQALLLAGAQGAEHVRCLDPGPDDALGEAPSTVLDLSGETPSVLRLGAIGEAALALVLDRIEGVGSKR